MPAMPKIRNTKRGSSKPVPNYFETVTQWIVDTGSGVDICGVADIPKDGKGLVFPDSNVTFLTANGPVPSGPLYPGMLHQTSECIAPYVLEQTPALLSVGKRCMDTGFGF